MPLDPMEVVNIAREAGAAIMEVYTQEEMEVVSKSDSSPLTKADLDAHEAIQAALRDADPLTPLVSEEGRSGNPSDSQYSWLVDPLDGTKEFVKRNGMFTVNIALMKRQSKRWTPEFGVVYAPVDDIIWVGGADYQAEKITGNNRSPIKVNEKPSKPIKLVASGSHRGDSDEVFAEQLGDHELIRMGSSLKACVVAEGTADLYPRFGPTSCWDIAAAHAVVESAGGIVVGPNGKKLDYDIVNDVLNPFFLVACSPIWNSIWVANQS